MGDAFVVTASHPVPSDALQAAAGDITSSTRTVDAGDGAHEANDGTSFWRGRERVLRVPIATRVSQAGRPRRLSYEVGYALIGTSSSYSASSRFSCYWNTFVDRAPRVDTASSIRTIDADGSLHEAAAGTILAGLKTGP